jgi:hypothetical protein
LRGGGAGGNIQLAEGRLQDIARLAAEEEERQRQMRAARLAEQLVQPAPAGAAGGNGTDAAAPFVRGGAAYPASEREDLARERGLL